MAAVVRGRGEKAEHRREPEIVGLNAHPGYEQQNRNPLPLRRTSRDPYEHSRAVSGSNLRPWDYRHRLERSGRPKRPPAPAGEPS